jgi:hypothetical protein
MALSLSFTQRGEVLPIFFQQFSYITGEKLITVQTHCRPEREHNKAAIYWPYIDIYLFMKGRNWECWAVNRDEAINTWYCCGELCEPSNTKTLPNDDSFQFNLSWRAALFAVFAISRNDITTFIGERFDCGMMCVFIEMYLMVLLIKFRKPCGVWEAKCVKRKMDLIIHSL